MDSSRRAILRTSAAFLAASASAPLALAQWQESPRYPDPLIQIVDPSFARYRINTAKVERLASGMRWSEGPVWFGDGRGLHRNRLFMAASTSLYSLYVNTQGAVGG